MLTYSQPNVAVLLATYNGSQFIEAQLRSLTENATPFTLHWIDDRSNDNTRETVRAVTSAVGIRLCEWHQPQHIGLQGVFFRLLECVEADIYLFCDQDDIWQPQKIDATVASLSPDVASPVLCYSDPLFFQNDEPGNYRRSSEVLGVDPLVCSEASRMFMSTLSWGHTIGLTRPLRELFLKHKDIACSYALLHDWWMYLIAVASGTARMLRDVPTTLYRRHTNNSSSDLVSAPGIRAKWRRQQFLRTGLARQAQGFLLASATLPAGPKLDQAVALAELIVTLDRRQSPAALLRLARRRAMPAYQHHAFWLVVTCLCSHAAPSTVRPSRQTVGGPISQPHT
jgi:rhamnosyltransferase